MTLTHSKTHDWADSSGDMDETNVRHHNGLNDFGREVVRELNRLGMMVDISHVSDKTFYDVLDVTRAPVIASHSSARARAENSRNMSDDMLRAVARNRGVVMVNFYDFFVDPRKAPFSREVRDLNRRLHKEYPHDPRRVYEEMEKWKQEKGLMPTPLSV